MDKSSKMHKFFLNNKYLVLDVNTGAVHVVDKIVYEILDFYGEKTKDEIIGMFKSVYGAKAVEDVYKEIEELVKEGLLLSDDIDISNFKYNESNIVKAMCLHVAHDCNLKCNYCFASQGNFKGEKSMMSLEVGKKSLEYLAKNSGARRNLEVDFFGGEPLMNFELVKDLVDYGRTLEKEYNKNFRFTITTNGILLDEDKIDFINENMDNVVLSLDGRKDVNDNMRKTINGEGSYDIILPKFKKMVEKRGDKDYYIRGTFTSNNIDFSKDALDFYNNGFKKISIEPVVTPEEMDYALREEHLDAVLNEYEELSKEYINIKRNDKDFYFFHFMIDLNQGPCIVKRAVGCGAGSEYMAVTPEGDLYPCHQFVGENEFKMGNVFDGVENTDLRDKFKNANVYNKEECRKCWARFYCSGGCHANSYHAHNDLKRSYSLGCEMEKKRIECAISILANLDN
ncbi:thioether cross-link-forming SCIFF peptide maturase [Tissierella sp. MB52-C2]|uniref:thioether cross-link-forming SCIFF peptide maturase n=1 Tax=Tissierella sp. MB52-C2 TaxID=3070999 RepID=UPI00280A6775|nr:thioether cross-link-forming SCIFF peptide maturase [Tissierella sp. MB52-C2]WMM26834.1 thioether cross-link-forming SCIFF peptide maturase [Tissierella sp. MB52-C2]